MHLQFIEAEDIWKMTSQRKGEVKIGEKLLAGSDFSEESSLADCPAKFVVIGIPEDAGPRANCGRGGSESAWSEFLSKFVNLQQTELLKGEDILLLGAFHFEKLPGYELGSVKKLRKIVEKIDEAVSEVISKIVAAGKIPIVIGGGHNNSFGLLKGTSEALQKAVNCVNLDPHADYRALEGRHSGNGFSCAKAQGFLEKYSIIGLHENYNSQEMIDRMEQDLVDYSTYEAIFLREEIEYLDAVNISLTFVGAAPFGVELDCDAIENFPSSAMTPSGITALQARQYVHHAGRLPNAAYLHLPEAAPSLAIDENSGPQVGKMLSYLVSDFVKARK